MKLLIRSVLIYARIIAIIVLIGICRILITKKYMWIVELNGCILNAGSANLCEIGGVDFSNAFYTLGFGLFFAMYIGPPLSIVLLAGYIVYILLIISLSVINRIKQKQSERVAVPNLE
ncbi:MAG: hypothetical protein N2D54_04405 [Chloroflexota bacterium]